MRIHKNGSCLKTVRAYEVFDLPVRPFGLTPFHKELRYALHVSFYIFTAGFPITKFIMGLPAVKIYSRIIETCLLLPCYIFKLFVYMSIEKWFKVSGAVFTLSFSAHLRMLIPELCTSIVSASLFQKSTEEIHKLIELTCFRNTDRLGLLLAQIDVPFYGRNCLLDFTKNKELSGQRLVKSLRGLHKL
ncbi:hypothetical protein M514_21682, partial [Trichuris suis]